jgi:hypothetical protein
VLFVFMSLYLIRRLHEKSELKAPDFGWAVLAGACIWFAISLRTVGITILGALFLYHVFRRRVPGIPILVCVATALLLYAAQTAWMPPAAGYIAQFRDAAASSGTPVESDLLRRLNRIFAAKDVVRMFAGTDVLWSASGELRAPPDGGLSRAVTVFLMVATSGLAMVGYFLRLRRPSIVEMFVLSYVGVLVLWGAAAARYLIPVFPLIFFYAVVGFNFLTTRGGRAVRASAYGLALLVGVIYVVNLASVNRSPYINGVTGPDALQLYSHVRNCTSADDRFLSHRPRTLALYTGREATSPGYVLRDHDTYVRFLQSAGIDHVVTSPESPLERLTTAAHGSFIRSFHSDQFAVYRYTPAAASGGGREATGC